MARLSKYSADCGDIVELTLSELGERDWRSRVDRWTRPFVIMEKNLFRRVWSIVLAILLVYTGTVFPFWLCFMEFKIPVRVPKDEVWTVLEWIVDILFWVDLLANFLFTYRDKTNLEVTSLRLIVYNYMCGFFLLNLVACLPEMAVMWVVNLLTGDTGGETSSINQATRMARLQRISRLTRLGRLTRLAKMAQFISSSPVMRWLRGLRGMRITNFIVSLLWVVHLIACGWYLCASMHFVPEETWVGRRYVDTEQTTTLLEQDSVVQYFHAMYFVLTVFTTVGFGDMSAVTTGEIVYVCFTMILGAVINSIIVSEVINIVTSVDREQVYRTKQKELVAAFSTHTELDDNIRIELERWIDNHSSMYMDYDEEGMKRLLISGALPRNLMAKLPERLFAGRLLRNNFVKICKQQVRQLPPRLPVLMALKVYQRNFNVGEFVYHYSDQPYHVFLVLKGSFSHVALPGIDGGVNLMHYVGGHCEESSPSFFNNWTSWGKMGYASTLAAKVKAFSKPGDSAASNRRFMSGTLVMEDYDPDNPTSQRPRLLPPSTSNGYVVCPYMLHSNGSFFGDVELMENKPRRSSVRCETIDSVLLVLHKQDFAMLIDEFPHFGRAWKASARRHERLQMVLLEQCTKEGHSRTYRELAATRIAQYYRDWRLRGGLSLCAKRTDPRIEVTPARSYDDEMGIECSSVPLMSGRSGASGRMPRYQETPHLGTLVGTLEQAVTKEATPYGVNINGEAYTRSQSRSNIRDPRGYNDEENPILAEIQKSISVLGDQLRSEMHGSLGELRDSVDELRRCVAPMSEYRRGRRTSHCSDRRPTPEFSPNRSNTSTDMVSHSEGPGRRQDRAWSRTSSTLANASPHVEGTLANASPHVEGARSSREALSL